MSNLISKKNILILGATGPLGILTVKEALSQDFTVTLFVRNPQKLPGEIKNNPKVTVIVGKLSDTDTLFPTLSTFSSIISVLGPHGMFYKGTVLADFYSALLQHLSSLPPAEVPYILALATPSKESPQDSTSWLLWVLLCLFRLVNNGAYLEIRAIAAAFEKFGKGLPWTLYRVGALTDGAGKGIAKAGWVGGWGSGWTISTARIDIARWLVKEVETEVGGRKWVGKMPALSSA